MGLTFIRQSTINHQSFTDRAPKLGGLVEFYRSPARVQWSPTGTNVPDYPKLAQLWWQNIGDAAAGAKTAQQAMDGLCDAQEALMERLEKSGVQGDKGPKLGAPMPAQYWFDQPGAPVTTSCLSRARVGGSASRLRSSGRPPSCAHEGIVASTPVPPAV